MKFFCVNISFDFINFVFSSFNLCWCIRLCFADVYEEVLEIVSYLTFYSPTISLDMWSLWPLMMEALNDWAIDFFESKSSFEQVAFKFPIYWKLNSRSCSFLAFCLLRLLRPNNYHFWGKKSFQITGTFLDHLDYLHSHPSLCHLFKYLGYNWKYFGHISSKT